MKRLTQREIEVLQLRAKGMKRGEIAYRLFISVKTVDFHFLKVREKLGLKSTAALTCWAARNCPDAEVEPSPDRQL